MWRVAIVIANSDGSFDEAEQKAVRTICNELGLPASDFFEGEPTSSAPATASAPNNFVDQVAKHKSGDFLNAMIAGGTLIAYADGNVSAVEKDKLLTAINQSAELRVFNSGDVRKHFDEIADSYDFDHSIGETEALKRIGKIKGNNNEQANLLVNVSIAIAKSDNNYIEPERAAIRKICQELSLSASDFDV